jgi:hypothetical protein
MWLIMSAQKVYIIALQACPVLSKPFGLVGGADHLLDFTENKYTQIYFSYNYA